jgi:hypothetical protein
VSAPAFLDCEQGSAKWLLARCGRPTASCFGDIVTATGKAASNKAREGYMMELLGERITGNAAQHYESAEMRRGTQLEPSARGWYALSEGVEVQEVGFAYCLSGRAGASPDGLVGTDGGIEIKCQLLANHLRTITSDEVPHAWYAQMQGCMLATQREWWDWVSYTDEQNVPNRIKRVQRDGKFIAALEVALELFCDEMDQREADFRKQYGIAEREPVDVEALNEDGMTW